MDEPPRAEDRRDWIPPPPSEASRVCGLLYDFGMEVRWGLRSIETARRDALEALQRGSTADAVSALEGQALAVARAALSVEDARAKARLYGPEIEPKDLDVGELAREAWQDLLSYRPPTRTALEVRGALAGRGEVPLVSFALRRLLRNALVNAPEGGTVRVGKRGRAFYVADGGESSGEHRLWACEACLMNFNPPVEGDIGLIEANQAIRRMGGRLKGGKGRAAFVFTLGAL